MIVQIRGRDLVRVFRIICRRCTLLRVGKTGGRPLRSRPGDWSIVALLFLLRAGPSLGRSNAPLLSTAERLAALGIRPRDYTSFRSTQHQQERPERKVFRMLLLREACRIALRSSANATCRSRQAHRRAKLDKEQGQAADSRRPFAGVLATSERGAWRSWILNNLDYVRQKQQYSALRREIRVALHDVAFAAAYRYLAPLLHDALLELRRQALRYPGDWPTDPVLRYESMLLRLAAELERLRD